MDRHPYLRIGILESEWWDDSKTLILRGRSRWGLTLIGLLLSWVAGADTALYAEQPENEAPILLWDGGVR